LGRFKVSRTSQSESVKNKSDVEHSPETNQEELSQSDSRLDDDDPPHQMGRFLVEKVNKQELANDVKSHNNANVTMTSQKTSSGLNNRGPISNEMVNTQRNYEGSPVVLVEKTSTNSTTVIVTPVISAMDNEHGLINKNNNITTKFILSEESNHDTNHNQPLQQSSSSRPSSPSQINSIAKTGGSTNATTVSNATNSTNTTTTVTSAATASTSRPISQWSIQDCVRWVSSLGVAYVDYAGIFEKKMPLMVGS